MSGLGWIKMRPSVRVLKIGRCVAIAPPNRVAKAALPYLIFRAVTRAVHIDSLTMGGGKNFYR
jgi:hypothetical protein